MERPRDEARKPAVPVYIVVAIVVWVSLGLIAISRDWRRCRRALRGTWPLWAVLNAAAGPLLFLGRNC